MAAGVALTVAAPGMAAALESAVRVKVSMPAAPVVDKPCRVVARVGRPIGASVLLQERLRGRWRTVARGRLRGGSVILRCPASKGAGLRRFRVLVRRNGEIVARSRVLRARALPPPGAQPPSPLPAPPGSAPVPPALIDPAQFGQEGTGGPPSPQTLALLGNPKVVLSPAGRADLSAGRIDPRVVAVLAQVAESHAIVVGPICSDHAKFDPGGQISNHYWGRAADISAVDGEAVGPANAGARAVALSLASLPESYRPSEVGSPFVIAAPGFFTDAAHQDRVHAGFDQPIAPTWALP